MMAVGLSQYSLTKKALPERSEIGMERVISAARPTGWKFSCSSDELSSCCCWTLGEATCTSFLGNEKPLSRTRERVAENGFRNITDGWKVQFGARVVLHAETFGFVSSRGPSATKQRTMMRCASQMRRRYTTVTDDRAQFAHWVGRKTDRSVGSIGRVGRSAVSPVLPQNKHPQLSQVAHRPRRRASRATYTRKKRGLGCGRQDALGQAYRICLSLSSGKFPLPRSTDRGMIFIFSEMLGKAHRAKALSELNTGSTATQRM